MKIKLLAVSVIMAAASVISGCDKPAGAPASGAEAAKAGAPAVRANPDVNILYAQVGNQLAGDGKLFQPVNDIAQIDKVYAYSVYKGTSANEATVKVKVTDAAGAVVFEGEKKFKPAGETPVTIEVVPAGGPAWKPGTYQVLYTLDGVPDWKLSFNIKP